MSHTLCCLLFSVDYFNVQYTGLSQSHIIKVEWISQNKTKTEFYRPTKQRTKTSEISRNKVKKNPKRNQNESIPLLHTVEINEKNWKQQQIKNYNNTVDDNDDDDDKLAKEMRVKWIRNEWSTHAFVRHRNRLFVS